MKKDLRFICPKCKTENKEDLKRSTDKWKVVSSTCDTCGEQMVIERYYNKLKEKNDNI